MRLTATLKGHYEWEPVPTGTPISKADEDALRVKQMADGSWRMRVPVTRPTELIVDVPEQLIARQLADKARRGAACTRAEFVAQHIRDDVMQHHCHRSHLVEWHVHDDVTPSLMERALADAGVTDPVEVAEALKAYEAPVTDDDLNSSFKLGGRK